MLSCTEFADRLYDEDCRRAQEGRAELPADVAAHRRVCGGCGRAWAAAAQDLYLVRQAVGPTPAGLQRRIRIRLCETAVAVPPQSWAHRVAWCSLLGAAVMLAAAPSVAWLADLGPFLLALCGGSLAFAASTLNEALRRRM